VGRNQANLLQGTLDLLILKVLGDGEFYGLGIARRVEQDQPGHVQGQAGIAISGPSPHGRSWMAEFFLGRVGEPTGAQSITGAQKAASAGWALKPSSGRQFPAPSDTR
jgi:hypothetical protein